ncbi:unnamed protein product [Haemonchus placei]|uniref:HTH_48 domain-containing protein n=1 Tax=Haemonchus placei TaxID=6290 RepID=A0A0N4W8K0_HAEPC|nr:unnamed protein product [Haemonchus placei]
MPHNHRCNRVYLRHGLVLLNGSGWNAKEIHIKLMETYGEDVIPRRTWKTWFAGFKKGNFSIEDAMLCGKWRPCSAIINRRFYVD